MLWRSDQRLKQGLLLAMQSKWKFLCSVGGSHRETSGPNFSADHSGLVNISLIYVEPPMTDPAPSRFSSLAHADDGGDKYPRQNSFPQQPTCARPHEPCQRQPVQTHTVRSVRVGFGGVLGGVAGKRHAKHVLPSQNTAITKLWAHTVYTVSLRWSLRLYSGGKRHHLYHAAVQVLILIG